MRCAASATTTATARAATASRFLFLIALCCCNLGRQRSADVHALLAQPHLHQQRRLPPLSPPASSGVSEGRVLPALPTSTVGGGSRLSAAALSRGQASPPAALTMQQTGGNWEEYLSGGGSGRGGGGRGRGGAAATGGRDGGRTGSNTGGRGGGRYSTGGRARGRGGMRGGGGRGGRSDFGRGGGRGAYGNNQGAGGYAGRGRDRGREASSSAGRGAARGRERSIVGPGYNTDDFELVEEGTGDDGSWDDFGDFSDVPGQYNKPRGGDTAYVEDLGTELKVVTPATGSTFSAAPPADAVFGSDPNLTPVAGGGGSGGVGRSHNRERRALQRERQRRQDRDSEKGRVEGGRLWSKDDGADVATAAAVAAKATRVREGAQLRIKRREERERAERERQAAYFASLDDGDGEGRRGPAAATAAGGGTGGGGLDDLFGDYFSPQQRSSPSSGSSSSSPSKQQQPQTQQSSSPQRFAWKAPPTTASSWDDHPPPATVRGAGAGAGAASERDTHNAGLRRSPSEQSAGRSSKAGGGDSDRLARGGRRGGHTGYADYSESDPGQSSGGRFGQQERRGGSAGRGGGRRGRGGDGFEQFGGARGGASLGRGDGGGRVLDNSIWDADRWESTGSTAWINAGNGESAGGGRGSLPSWKVPKEEQPKAAKAKSAPVPDWLPRHGGLGSEARQGVAPLPEGIDTSVKKLGVKGLEAMLKKKFSKMKEGVFKGEDDDVDFYDPDDEGFEKPLEGGEQMSLVESEEDAPDGMAACADLAAAVQDFRGAVRYDDPNAPRPKGSGVVARSEAEAAGGGFRMRSPARAAGAATAAAADGDDGERLSGAPSIAAPESRGVAVREEKKRKVAAAAEAVREEEGEAEGEEEKEVVGQDNSNKKRNRNRKEAEAPAKPTYTPINIADMETLEVQESVSFRNVGIEDGCLLANIKKLGIKSPTDVQVSAIRGLLAEDRDVIIHAHTGSGKTLAYLLPLIAATDPDSNAVQAIVVAPGRELASQIFSVCERLIEGSGLRSALIIGGANALRQVERVKKVKPQIVIATPGRLCELVFDRRRMKLGMVNTVVLDEVDALLRPPYDQEIDAIMDATPGGRRQAVFASATGRSPVVSAASERYMREDPLFVGGQEAAGGGQRQGGLPSNILHTVVTMPKVKKFDTLRRLLNTQPFPESVMIFVNDPIQVNWLTERLETVGIIAAPLSGESSKDDRAEIMRRLQDKRIAMVVTTEMAARGLDVAHLTHVVNYDLPTDADHYVHRAGRCGRAGRPGIVVNMATPDVKFVLDKFSKSLALPFEEAEVQGGRFWSVSRPEKPSAMSAARAAVEAAKSETATLMTTGAAAAGVEMSNVGATVHVMETENDAAAAGDGNGNGIASGAVDRSPPQMERPRRPSSPVDKGFLRDDPVMAADNPKEVRAKEKKEGHHFDGLSLGVDVDDDILAEAKAFLEGGGMGAAAPPPLPSQGTRDEQQEDSPSEDFDDGSTEVYVDAGDDATAQAAAFLGGGRGPGAGAAAAAAAVEAVAASRLPPPQRKGKEPLEGARSRSGEEGDGPSSAPGRTGLMGVGEAFEVAGGIVIVHTAEPPEDGDYEHEVEGGWDEDDWGDGDWGDGEEDEEGEWEEDEEEEEGGA
eukprot:g9209.t1